MNNYEPDMLRRMMVGGQQQQPQSLLASPYPQTPPMIQGAPPIQSGGQGEGGMDIMKLIMSLGQMYGGSGGGGMMGGMGGM